MIGPMGKRNRERRKQKANRRNKQLRHQGQRGHQGRPRPDLDDHLIEAVVAAAAEAYRVGDGEGYAVLLAMLEAGPPAPGGAGAVDAVVLEVLEGALSGAWRGGWQPADVVRVVGKELSAAHVRVVVDATAAEARRYAAATVDRRWSEQLAALEAVVWWDPARSLVAQRAERDGVDRAAVIGCGIEVLSLLLTVPVLPRLVPPPGEANARARVPAGVDGRLLERVRALLAKAESTTFAEEADALTAKAQELMARHSIDQAMVEATQGGGPVAEGRRVGVEDPYAGAKALLLSRVAEANRCRSVWLSALGFSDVFGAATDLDAVELLFTSLLRQATTTMLAQTPRRRGGGSSTRSFRQSFLVAFAVRIGARLHTQDDATTAAAATDHGPGVLPVLAGRAAAADAAASEAFPHTETKGPAANDAAGWAAGTVAADLANLGVRGEVGGAAS
jgi:hypothetical protein